MAIHNPVGPSHIPPQPTAGRRWLVVTFQDLAPHTQRPCQELLLQLAELGVPRASLIVAPHRHAVESILERPFFLRWLRSLATAGHEIQTGEGADLLAAAGVPAVPLDGFDRRSAEGPAATAATVAFSTRSALHRAVSPLLARARFAATRRQAVLRIEVHPDDLYEKRLRHAFVDLVQRALADREPVTWGELARALAPSQV